MNFAFSARLKKLQEQSGYSQKQLAELVGVTEAAFSRYVNQGRVPKAVILDNIATALGTTSQFLLTGEEPCKNFAELRALVASSAPKISEKKRRELVEILLDISGRNLR